MGSIVQHYDLAKRLKRMADGHRQMYPGDPDWDAVMLFYAALHLASAYLLAMHCGVPRTHEEMAAAIGRRPELDDRFRKAYRTLSEFAWNARYNPGYVMGAPQKHMATDRFRIVKTFLEHHVRSALGLPPGSDF